MYRTHDSTVEVVNNNLDDIHDSSVQSTIIEEVTRRPQEFHSTASPTNFAQLFSRGAEKTFSYNYQTTPYPSKFRTLNHRTSYVRFPTPRPHANTYISNRPPRPARTYIHRNRTTTQTTVITDTPMYTEQIGRYHHTYTKKPIQTNLTPKPYKYSSESNSKQIHKEQEPSSSIITNSHFMPKSIYECSAVGPWAAIPGMDDWCVKNCNHVPSFCPTSHCFCP